MMPPQYEIIDRQKWKQKAMAFTVRSHQHLWGKNNEDPLAFLFKQGFRNVFMKNQYLGWNKFGQERPLKNWGFNPEPDQPETFLLPSGIVIPVIENKVLTALFIQQFQGDEVTGLVPVPGSRRAEIVLGESADNIVILKDLIDGLYLYQEIGRHCRIIILPHRKEPMDSGCRTRLKKASHITYAMKKNDIGPSPYAWGDDIKFTARVYQTKKDLVSLILS